MSLSATNARPVRRLLPSLLAGLAVVAPHHQFWRFANTVIENCSSRDLDADGECLISSLGHSFHLAIGKKSGREMMSGDYTRDGTHFGHLVVDCRSPRAEDHRLERSPSFLSCCASEKPRFERLEACQSFVLGYDAVLSSARPGRLAGDDGHDRQDTEPDGLEQHVCDRIVSQNPRR